MRDDPGFLKTDRATALGKPLHVPVKDHLGARNPRNPSGTGAHCSPSNIRSKRIFDIIVTVVVLFFVWPLLILIATAVLIDGGTIIYVHRRVGWQGRIFGCLKFRTMRIDAEAVLEATLREEFKVSFSMGSNAEASG